MVPMMILIEKDGECPQMTIVDKPARRNSFDNFSELRNENYFYMDKHWLESDGMTLLETRLFSELA